MADEDAGQLVDFAVIRNPLCVLPLLHRDFDERSAGAVNAGSELPPEAFLHVLQLAGDLVSYGAGFLFLHWGIETRKR